MRHLMTLTPEIIALLTLDILFLLLGTVAFAVSLGMVWRWDACATTALQYTLEKRSYLVSVIIKYLFIIKLPLFLFFIYTLDKLSDIITGAMCATGVVNAVDFGFYLTTLKLINLYGFGFWLLVHHADMKHILMPYTRMKLWLFILLFIPLIAEISLEILFFSSLNISKIVSCCGTLFSAASSSYTSLLFKVDALVWVGFFYFFAGLVLVAYRLKNTFLMIFANSFFLIFAIISLIVFFSTYVYELPTHRCPFCLLQKEYYGVGYLLYTTLFIGTFSGMGGALLQVISHEEQGVWFKRSLFFNGLYVGVVSLYPLMYYLKNGVWL